MSAIGNAITIPHPLNRATVTLWKKSIAKSLSLSSEDAKVIELTAKCAIVNYGCELTGRPFSSVSCRKHLVEYGEQQRWKRRYAMNFLMWCAFIWGVFWFLGGFYLGFIVQLENDGDVTMGTSPLPMKGCKFWPMLDTHGNWAVSVLYWPRLLWNGAYVDNGHLPGPMTLTPTAER